MRALVTGGAGFIGSTLVDRLLAEGRAVDVVDDLSSGSLANLADARADRGHDIRFHHADIRTPEVADLIARRRPGVVFHLAAAGGGGRCAEAEVAVVGLVNVVEGARAAGAKVVAASNLDGSAVDAAALAYLAACRELEAVEYTALALATVYGPRRSTGVVAAFVAAAASSEQATIHGDGGQARDFLFVDDAVDAFVRAATRGSGLVVDVGTGVATTVADLHRLVSSSPPRYQATAMPEPPPRVADPSRAGIYLGWKPWTALGDGVRQTMAAAAL